MIRFNCWVHYIGDAQPTLATWFSEKTRNAEQLAHAYVAQMLGGQAWQKAKYIQRAWVEVV